MTFPPCYEDIIELGLPDGALLPCDDTDVYTSKLGGRPVWLNAPSKDLLESLKCPKCSTDLYLLLQMDCPREEYPSVDRVAYIFVCNTRLCSQDVSGWRVIFMMKHKDDAGTSVEAVKQEAKASFWDSLMNEKEVEEANNSLSLSNSTSSTKKSSDAVPLMTCKNQFPGLYLHIDEEIIVEKREKKSAPVVEVPVSADATDDAQDWSGEQYEKVRAPGTDKSFNRFQKRVAHYPRQCVRYAVSGAQTPLLYHDLDLPTAVNKLGQCSKCSLARCDRFELQLMPAVLAFLPTESPAHLKHVPESKRSKNPIISDGMEWGTVLVYSCGAFCGLDNEQNRADVVEGRVIIQLELEQ